MTTEPQEIPKQFDHRSSEADIFALWEKNRVFEARVDPSRKPFCVVMPPPNVTGILHMGHVLDNVPQDVMTRWHRMRGFSAVWIPGTDHAGIATQSVVIKNLKSEGIDFRSLGREKFIERVWDWKKKHGDLIINQLKRIGCSCDWSRERFTMDEGFSRAVLTAFLRYYEKGLVYKGKRMINWCTSCGTALADDEVEHEERGGNLWHIRYPILDTAGNPTNEFVTVATTRPETMLGDTAVAVHPDDTRYTHLHGKKVLLPLQNRAIPVIADAFVDPKFGTGVVKITPAHDPNDYTAGIAHGLEFLTVIGNDGTMTEAAGAPYTGLDRDKARKAVVADIEKLGLMEQIEKHKHAVGTCYRCKSVVEPMVSAQWFVKMRPLAEKATQAVRDGSITIVPESERHDYFHWMDNIQDWCISRQLWWGHRIPVFYCQSCDHVEASLEAPALCVKCDGKEFSQDEDVLDTWFSSQLWPYGTLGWPEQTEELKYWYPNTWLMSGRDILFFWDARMIMSGLELMGDVPFRSLALHGLVRDEHGRKLSKSLGNSPDPLELFDQYGTDAVRAAIALHYPMGRLDTRLADQVYQRGQSLVTKLWNASRYLMMSLEGAKVETALTKLNLGRLEDRWIISRLRSMVETHDRCLSQSDFTHAVEAVNNFFWNDYCDWYLEIIKPRVREGGDSQRDALGVALFCQRTLLKMFHPYCPFVTEELWQTFGRLGFADASDHAVLASSAWPTIEALPSSPESDRQMDIMMSLVSAMRDLRQNLMISAKEGLGVKLAFHTATERDAFASSAEPIATNLGFLSSVAYESVAATPGGAVPVHFSGGIGYVTIPAEVDIKDIATRLDQKIGKLEKTLAGSRQRLANPAFVAQAPQQLVDESRAQVEQMEETLARLQEFRRSIG